MNSKHIVILAVLCALSWAQWSAALADDEHTRNFRIPEMEQLRTRGLRSLYLRVECGNIDPKTGDEYPDVLTKQAVRASVLKKLQDAGLLVHMDSGASNTLPLLFMSSHCQPENKQTRFDYDFEVNFIDPQRDKQFKESIWSQSEIRATKGPEDIKTFSTMIIDEFLAKFKPYITCPKP